MAQAPHPARPLPAPSRKRRPPWKYQRSGSSVTITGYDGELAGDVTIPSKIGDDTVTAIGNNAFDGNEKITSVTIPGTVKGIRQYAFRSCKNLKKITLQEGVESIGYYAFAGCTNLTEVNLPTTLNYIENLAFRSCVNLEQIVIPENSKGQETKIQHCAFEFCSKLKKVYFPKTLKTLYDPFTGDTSVDYIYYGGTKEDWAKIHITDGSINSTTVILYAQKPADINTTPTVPGRTGRFWRSERKCRTLCSPSGCSERVQCSTYKSWADPPPDESGGIE